MTYHTSSCSLYLTQGRVACDCPIQPDERFHSNVVSWIAGAIVGVFLLGALWFSLPTLTGCSTDTECSERFGGNGDPS